MSLPYLGLEAFWQEHANWSQATFGSDQERGPIGPLRHLAKEVQEILAKPDDLEEYADAVFLIFDACRRAGFTFIELVTACFQKLDVNKRRTWQKPTSPNEAVEHVRELCLTP